MSIYNEDRLSSHYSEFYAGNKYNKREFELYKKYFKLLERKGYFSGILLNQLIDLGCGNGIKTSAFAQFFNKTTAVDLSTSAIEKAKELNPDVNVTFVCANVFDLVAEKSDVVTAFGFSYLNEENTVLLADRVQELIQMLGKDNMRFIMSSFTDFSGTAPSGWVMHSKEQLKALEDNLNERGYKMQLYFPQYDWLNYINFGIANGLKELIKVVKSKRRTFFIIIEKQ